jgi:hypothetical protein
MKILLAEGDGARKKALRESPVYQVNAETIQRCDGPMDKIRASPETGNS